MKILYFCLSLILSLSTFGQLFPKVSDYKGNIKQVVEKRYGKEANFLKLFKNSYHSGAYSGWKYTYQFKKHTKLISQSNTFKGKVAEETLFQHEKSDNRLIEREIMTDRSSTNQGNYTEYENFIGPDNRIEKVNFWAFNSKECTRKIFLVEQNVEYKQNKLTAFTRLNINANGNPGSSEQCALYYDSSNKLIRIERKDVETGFTTILRYYYTNHRLIDHYSVDYLVGLNEYGKKNLTQEVYFKYDKRGNWIKKYIKSGKKKQLEAKRRIKYF